jgi:endonuclease YncB( thermonuclease family)
VRLDGLEFKIMGFIVIKGQFRPEAGRPDGDSVRFKADDDGTFELLKGIPVEFRQDGSVQLRYEGIDAIEKAAIEPLATQAKEKNFEFLRENSSDTDNGVPGYILSRATDRNRRPVAIAFSGTTKFKNGQEVFLKPELLQESVNYKLVASGYAYVMFYKTFFAELRIPMAQAFQQARQSKLALHEDDGTLSGVVVNSKDDLATINPIFPKLWRRLEEYSRNNVGLDKFPAFLQRQKESLFTISDGRFLSFDNVVEVKGNQVKLLYSPEDMLFEPK